MQWVELSAQQRARRRFAVIGAAVIAASVAGLLVGWSEAQSKDLTPAEVVAFRFPGAWSNLPASNLPAQSAPGVTAVAKRQQILFDPNPSYDLASADSRPVIPSGVLAYADPVVTSPAEAAPQAPEARPSERKVPPRPAAKPDNHVLNDAQISAIKARLKLTPDQQRHWPGVEAALRGIAYKVNKSGGKLASIDPESAEVQQLKSAAIPLIMMLSEQQKGEVRQLVQVMGLQRLAAQF
jgi:hypothetical protein